MADVLTVESDEGVEQIQARLAHVQSRQVYVHLPQANAALRQRFVLLRLQRAAEDLGLELTLVTRDSATRVMADHVGFRVARQLPSAKREAPENGQPDLDREHAAEPAASQSAAFDASSSLLKAPYAVVALAVLLLALGFALAFLVLPHATITVSPVTSLLETVVEIVADPDVGDVDVAGRRMPARRLEVTLVRQAKEPTSAQAQIPVEPARGQVVVVNQREAAVTIPAGSLFKTSDGTPVAFRNYQSVTVPGPAGAMATTEVEAIEPGPAGNVPAYTVTVLDPSLGLPVAVVNPTPFSGGLARSVGVVTEQQMQSARDALVARVRAEAEDALRTQLRAGEVLVEPTIDVQVVEESFSAQAGEFADEFSVEVTVLATATAVEADRARELAQLTLREAVPAEQAVVAGSLNAEIEETTVGAGGAVRLRVRSTARVQDRIEEDDIKNAVRGRPVDEAASLLSERFPLQGTPVIDVSRSWIGRLPWLPMQIEVVISNRTTVIGERWVDETHNGFRRG